MNFEYIGGYYYAISKEKDKVSSEKFKFFQVSYYPCKTTQSESKSSITWISEQMFRTWIKADVSCMLVILLSVCDESVMVLLFKLSFQTLSIFVLYIMMIRCVCYPFLG